MRRISPPAVASAVFMIIALCVVGWSDWDRAASFGIVVGLCAVASALLALRDR